MRYPLSLSLLLTVACIAPPDRVVVTGGRYDPDGDGKDYDAVLVSLESRITYPWDDPPQESAQAARDRAILLERSRQGGDAEEGESAWWEDLATVQSLILLLAGAGVIEGGRRGKAALDKRAQNAPPTP